MNIVKFCVFYVVLESKLQVELNANISSIMFRHAMDSKR